MYLVYVGEVDYFIVLRRLGTKLSAICGYNDELKDLFNSYDRIG